MSPLYEIDRLDLGSSDRYECWSSVELSSYGDSLADLLDNAEYSFTDQDGGELGNEPANDRRAIQAIKAWYAKHGTTEVEPPRETDPMTLAKDSDDGE